jgi:Sensory domain in DIguanylate Cyclases and Two-component system
MTVRTSCEKATCHLFKKKLKQYLPPLKTRKKNAVRLHHGRNAKVVTVGEAVAIPASDVSHVFDSELMLAISHSIEDIALEMRQGELISTFQKFDNFLHQKERYVNLAKDLDAVRVWGSGPAPKRCSGIDFINTEGDAFKKYWMVLFDSPKCRALLLCKQVNRTSVFSEKKYVGFYTFNPYLVQSVRWRFNLLSCGLSNILKHWEKSFPLPDLKMKDLESLLPKPRG